MKLRFACLTALLTLSSTAWAASPRYLVIDQSTPTLMDKATALATVKESVTPKMLKLYSPKKWGFATEVQGGFTPDKTCVVTARAMMLPVAVSGKTLVFKAAQKATAFNVLPNATQEQCSSLAKSKLKEAVQALAFGLMKN